ncbi:hypothetical protein NORO109296_09965 [Nocardiopsis rhodophaea]
MSLSRNVGPTNPKGTPNHDDDADHFEHGRSP